ncbi:hypothetical protein P8452_48082 [Trifolium repens]|nr:hypothetical protein P8452_48082 [Trifolium repens]
MSAFSFLLEDYAQCLWCCYLFVSINSDIIMAVSKLTGWVYGVASLSNHALGFAAFLLLFLQYRRREIMRKQRTHENGKKRRQRRKFN